LTPGNRNDITQAEALTSNISDCTVLGDKGYDSDDFVKYLINKDCTAVIPSRKTNIIQRECCPTVYKSRNIIERFFSKLKQFRRIGTRYDKTATAYKAFINLTSALIYARKNFVPTTY
jgi:transposase